MSYFGGDAVGLREGKPLSLRYHHMSFYKAEYSSKQFVTPSTEYWHWVLIGSCTISEEIHTMGLTEK